MAVQAILFFLSVMALAVFQPFDEASMAVRPKRETIAANYVVYRAAVIAYAHENTAFTGEAALAALSTPSGFRPLRPWRNYIDGGAIYVYGPHDPGVAMAVVEDLTGTRLAGRNIGGGLVSPIYGAVAPLPGWCPDNQLISVVYK